MAIYEGISKDYVNNNVQNKLLALRKALEELADVYLWLSAYSAADLVALGFSQDSADNIKSALADAYELYQLYNGGSLGSYTLPFNFSASQRRLIGPLT